MALLQQSEIAAPPDARSLPELLEATAARFPGRPAIAFFGRRWTFAQLRELVERVAHGLQLHGVGKDARVGLCLPNTPYSAIFYYAILKAGGTVVNYNPLYVERELLHQMRDSTTRIMVVPDLAAIHGKVANVAAAAGLRRIIVCPMRSVLPPAKAALFALLRRREHSRVPRDDRHISFARLLDGAGKPDAVPIRAGSDVAVLQYTGGTTGTPKGAMLTHANLTANSRQVIEHMPSLRPGEERLLGVLPLFHVFAMTTVLNVGVELGAEMILLPRFEIRQVMRCIARDKPTLFPAVPTIYAAINAAAGHTKADLSSIRICISGGAPLPEEVRLRFQTLTGCRLVEGYGLSEASPVVACNPPDGEIRPGSVGIPVRGTTVEIRNPDHPHRMFGVGEKGEVCVRGPQVMAGYWRRPEETKAVFVDGALRTGDIGYLDADGYLFLVDRIKDIIICGGYNVYPRVLEEALYRHPAVAEAVAIGIPDAHRGQSPTAFVTLRAGATATSEELLAHLAGYVSRIEMPKAVEIRTSLPKTMIGKLSKKELIEEARQRAGPT